MICFGILVMYCVSQQPAVANGATFCQIAKPVYWDATDTRQTKEQIDKQNRIGKRLCGWK